MKLWCVWIDQILNQIPRNFQDRYRKNVHIQNVRHLFPKAFCLGYPSNKFLGSKMCDVAPFLMNQMVGINWMMNQIFTWGVVGNSHFHPFQTGWRYMGMNNDESDARIRIKDHQQNKTNLHSLKTNIAPLKGLISWVGGVGFGGYP